MLAPLWRHLRFREDIVLTLLIILAVVLSIASFWVAFSGDTTLLYYDAKARMLITRRVIDSPTPGLAQLGGVWLPLTHVAALPLIMFDPLFREGIAGSIISMFAFVLTAVYLYRIGQLLVGSRAAGVIASLVFITNLNVLYVQSTPMTEVPMFAAMAASVYYLLRFVREPQVWRWSLLSGVALTAGSLIRYEVWPLLLCWVIVITFALFRQRLSFGQIEARLLHWGYWAFLGVGAWFAWNWAIFGDPLSFQRGEYAKPSLWVSEGAVAIGNLGISTQLYSVATLLTVGPVLILGALGLLWALRRLRAELLIPLALLTQFPFFVLMVYLGQRPLDVPQVTGDMYNIRFALVIVLPVSIFAAYLVGRSRLRNVLVAAAVLGGNLATLLLFGIITLTEPLSAINTQLSLTQIEAAAWFNDHYQNGMILMESYGNDEFQFVSDVDLRNILYEGSYRLWDAALEQPQQYAEWVVMRPDVHDNGSVFPADKLWLRWHDDPAFHEVYELLYVNDGMMIYRQRSLG